MSVQMNGLNEANLSRRMIHIQTVCGTRRVTARAIVPEVISEPPILAIHGISRDSDAVTQAFQQGFRDQQRVVIVPHFDKASWPVFQRITAMHRPDLALLSILGACRQNGVIGREPVDIFGYSGGAQLAHRFAMLCPEKVGRMYLAAAGWYTLPDEQLPYPLGIGPGKASRRGWHKLMADGLPQFLSRPIKVYVGDKDVIKDKALRSDPLLDQIQGSNRFDRAERYVDLINQRQKQLGLPTTAQLEPLPNCSHDFVMCCENGDLVRRLISGSEL